MWGLPDGLEFCTHDSYEIDAKSSKLIEKRMRGILDETNPDYDPISS